MFDFGSSFRREGGTRGRNNKGLVTMDRKIKKDSYYVYKAWFSDEPFVHMAGRRYAVRPGNETEIRVYSNQPEVTLYINGEPWQTKSGSHVFVFTGVPLNADGCTFLTAKAGCCADNMTLRSASEKPEHYTFPDFQESMDARNWFNSLEELASSLEAPEGYYSIHDKMSELGKCREARQVIRKAVMVMLERNLPEEMLFPTGESHYGIQRDAALEDMLSGGFFANIAQEKREDMLKRINKILNKIKKQ
jgi:beta-galactosidase